MLSPAVTAGVMYFWLVFAAGFLLGLLRVMFIAPAVGEAAAVALELPIMLTVSWFVCKSLIGRLHVPAHLPSRLIMGGIAFLLLMLAEFAISSVFLGRSLAKHLDHYRELPALLGLAGQAVFAALPSLQMPAGKG